MKAYVMLSAPADPLWRISIFAVVDAILPGNGIDPFKNLLLLRRTRSVTPMGRLPNGVVVILDTTFIL